MTAPVGRERDFVGYGGCPPDPRWPGDARLALNLVVNYEEGSEPSIADGDPDLTDAPSPGGHDLAAESMFEYGSRVGYWRLSRILGERNLPVTLMACALALERNPAVAADVVARGWDVCAHGWRRERHAELDEAAERDRIARTVASLARTVGQRPLGWYCRYTRLVPTQGASSRRRADFYTTPTPTMTSSHIGCASTAYHIWSCPTALSPTTPSSSAGRSRPQTSISNFCVTASICCTAKAKRLPA
jgi:peptidoglycan/xylan/chitin deacetylase (PgdA/CDA1 family)